MNRLEKFLTRRIELWMLMLLSLFGLLVMLGFGFAAVDGTREKPRFGVVSEAAVFLATIPDTLKSAITAQDRMEIYDSARFDGEPTGWTFAEGPLALDGYLLLSRYDGDRHRHVVELVSMRDWTTVHSWWPDADSLLSGVEVKSQFTQPNNWTTHFFRAIHPVLTQDGGLILKDHFSPLMRIGACSDLVWRETEHPYHHSTQPDAEGNLWVGSVIEPTRLERTNAGFQEDALAQVSQDGEVKQLISVPQMLIDHDLTHLLFTNGKYNFDPVHLNDIEPVLADGPHWRRGDLFLSLRNISAIVQYRPSTDEIVWMQQGPWLSQHDVDILDDHRIAIFDNQAEDRGGWSPFVARNSRIMVHDFDAGTDTELLADAMAREEIKGLFAGNQTVLPDGHVLVEEVTDARLMMFDAAGRTVAQFVNRAGNGRIYQLGWSRVVTQEAGDAALDALKGTNCDE